MLLNKHGKFILDIPGENLNFLGLCSLRMAIPWMLVFILEGSCVKIVCFFHEWPGITPMGIEIWVGRSTFSRKERWSRGFFQRPLPGTVALRSFGALLSRQTQAHLRRREWGSELGCVVFWVEVQMPWFWFSPNRFLLNRSSSGRWPRSRFRKLL